MRFKQTSSRRVRKARNSGKRQQAAKTIEMSLLPDVKLPEVLNAHSLCRTAMIAFRQIIR